MWEAGPMTARVDVCLPDGIRHHMEFTTGVSGEASL